MTDGERDLLVTLAKIVRTQLETKIKTARGGTRERLKTDLAQLCGALVPFEHDAPPPPEGAPV